MPATFEQQGLRIGLVFHGPGGGGAERVILTLAEEFIARGIAVDLVMSHREGSLRKNIPSKANLIDISPTSRLKFRVNTLRGPFDVLQVLFRKRNQRHAIRHAPAISRYLRRWQPSAVIAAEIPYNLATLLAREWSGTRIPVILREGCDLGHYIASRKLHDREAYTRLIPRLYPRADALVANSNGVSASICRFADIEPDKLNVIYNPIVSDALKSKAREPVEHPRITGKHAVIAVGRLHPQKDYPMLLRAFARLRAERPVKLMILGTGEKAEYREQLESICKDHGLTSDVSFLGFVENPIAYMSRASLLALSSTYEGLPTVLIEAMACGCPVVSTDCPSGPAEILDNGTYGPLVPVGDDLAFAKAMRDVLDNPPAPQILKSRAAMFSVEQSVNHYLALIESCINRSGKITA